MAEWEINPYEQFPQTPELYFKQLEQELESIERRKEYLLSERQRIMVDIDQLGIENI